MSIEKINQGDQLSQSADLVNDNIDKLKSLFPEIVTEGRIDFKVLQQVLGEELEEEEEYYRFTWAGKSQSRREAHKPSTGTLRPAKEESLDWDTTQNMYIEGDNLEVLKLLQKSYAGKIKMIYIDPPYNTGKDFVYKDNYKDNLKNYQEVTGQIDSEGNKTSTNSDSDGRYHSNWLNMMYPRLRLARNLLKEDGVIFMSIDENELDNLIKLGNEVFGESNKISEIVWEKKTGASDSKTISSVTEYVLIYLKNINSSESIFNKNLDSFDPKRYKHKDEYFKERGPFYFDTLDRGGLQYSDSLNYQIRDKEGKSTYPNGREEFKKDGWIWKWSESKVKWGFENGFIEIRESKNRESGHSVYYKNYLKVNNEGNPIERSAPKKNLIKGVKNLDGSKDIKEVFESRVFDYPKPVKYLIELFDYIKTDNEYVLDFFSGSSSSAHAVLMSNLKSNQISKYIQVQLPEKTEKNSDAFLQGYSVISDIGKERIRRVVKKIKEEHSEKSKDMDLGFKVFKLDSSNIKSWDGETKNTDGTEREIKNQIKMYEQNIKTDRTEEDVLYEILLKYGLDLTLPIEEKIIEGKKVFNVGLGSLFICLSDNITAKVAEGIGQLKEECSPEICRVIFKDNGFTDVEKTNSVQTLKRYGINEIRSI